MTAPSINIAAHLPAMAQRQPYTLAVVYPAGRDRKGRVAYTHYTFEQLDRQSDRIASGLEAYGLKRNDRVALMVTPSLELFALVFALFKAGLAPVMIDPGMGVKNIGVCLREANPDAFIGIPKAMAARATLGWAKTVKLAVTVGPRRWWGSVSLDAVIAKGRTPYAMAQTAADELAAILFTSGSTGVPKGAIYSHGNFAAQVEMIRETYSIEPGEVDLPTFPLFALFDPALGMTAIIPDMNPSKPANVDPRKIIEPIENFGVTNMFGSPALLNRIGRYGQKHGIKFPSLRRVISAGAPVPAAVLERFAGLLSDTAQIFTPYGATEALPVSSIGSRQILTATRQRTDTGGGVCVGLPNPRATVRIIGITPQPIENWSDELCLPPGEIGEIVVAGPMVTRGYYNRPESTKLAKIADPANGTFYHRMGDVGYFDDDGQLWFCGRRDHRVVQSDRTRFTIPCEAVFNTHPDVFRTALVGVERNGMVRPVLCVEMESSGRRRSRRALIAELRQLAQTQPHTADIDTFLFHRRFPVDVRHNTKIFREKLKLWAERRLR